LLSANAMQAQEEEWIVDRCATVFADWQLAAVAELTLTDVPVDPGTHMVTASDVKIQFHQVCTGGVGTAPLTATQINNALAYVNTKFANSGLHFVQCSAIEYIENWPSGNMNPGDLAAVQFGAYDRTKAV